MVEIKDLEVTFGAQKVLRGITLSIPAGETFALMGSSGGGKTTLLRSIAGLQRLTAGSVHVEGIDVAKQPVLARAKMGMVFQSAALFDFLSVSENVAFGVDRLRPKVRTAEIERRVKEALESVGLGDAGDKSPDELSGGMRKRVGIARARVLKPCLMLYDEPTTGLDPITTFAIDELISRVPMDANGSKVTSILVSHDLNSVLRVADRIAFLHQGQIVFLGSKEEFLSHGHPAVTELIEKSRATALLA